MKYELKAYSFGETIGKGFNLYFDNFIFLVCVSLVAKIPITLWGFFFSFLSGNKGESKIGVGALIFVVIGGIVTAVLSFVVSFFIIGLYTQVISKKYLGQDLTKKDYLSVLPLILPLIGLGIIQGLGIMAASILLIVPGVIVALGWMVATQILVIENKGVFDSLSRSWELTRGKKGHIFLLFVVIIIIQVALTMIPNAIIGFTMGLFSSNAILSSILIHVIEALVEPVSSCILIVLYFNLRVEKEGFNLEHMVEQYTINNPNEKIEM